MLKNIILQLHGGKGGSSTTVQSYKPTAEEKRLWKQQGDFQEVVMPYAESLVGKSSKILENSLGDTQYDFGGLNSTAQQQIANAQQGVQQLQSGVLPTAYQENMENSIKSGVQNTMGSTLNSLASRGVLNSSVTNQAMNDISKNVSDTMAEQYSNNISTLNGLYGQQTSLATNGISAAAAAQEAAQSPSLSLLNAALGVSSSNTGAISALKGSGTTTTTGTTSNNTSGIWSGLAGLGSAAITAYCFVKGTLIKTVEGVKSIERFKAGDKVLQYEPSNDSGVEQAVVAVCHKANEDVFEVETRDSIGGRHCVICSATQPFMKVDHTWVDVKSLTIGTELMFVGLVTKIAHASVADVYDLKVEGNNSYIANDFIAMGAYDEELTNNE